MNCYLMVGPSAYDLDRTITDSGVVSLPPARRGDVERLRARTGGTTGCLAIVDGLFHSQLAVSHRELRAALEAGWEIWGLSSMGAIRAAEMVHMGMKGYGSVFRRFVEDPSFPDDEVALLHGEEAPYRPVSEPLVHLRRAVVQLKDDSILSSSASHRILASLRCRWFGYRTLDCLFGLLEEELGGGVSIARSCLCEFDRFRTKKQDLIEFLRERPWSIR